MKEFVLVPGAWCGAWLWKKVTPILEEPGHSVHPVTLTGMADRVHLANAEISIETAIKDVMNFIRYNELQRVVLVGHSFAGKVVASVADRMPAKIEKLIYLDAVRPKKGPAPQGDFPDEWPVTGSVIPFPEKILEVVGKDIQGADRDWLVSMATPLPVRYFRDPITLTGGLRAVRNGYVFCTNGGDDLDATLKEEGPYKDYEIEGPHRVIDSGHWPMISKPRELAQDLLELAEGS